MVDVTILNPEITGWYNKTKEPITKWYEEENDRRKNLESANKALMGLLAAQMLLYLIEFLKNLDDRDDMIDKIIDFNQYLHDKKHGVDLQMVREKTGIINLALPEVYQCSDVTRHSEFTMGDARAVDGMSEQFAKMSCGIPNGWSMYEGELEGARVIADHGGFIVNASKREREWMQKQKTSLMVAAQRNIKSPFSASGIMAGYTQSMGIYSGLADLYAQGFNSAGAGLGVLLGRMTSSPVPSTNTGVNGGSSQ